MPLIVNTNISSINAQRNLTANTNALSKSLERLSSGFRINRAGDDAAGLQISETLRAQIRGAKKALENAQDGINLLNIADGAQGVIQDNLQRIRELTIQAVNDTLDTPQRDAINSEINARLDDITRIAESTEFNGVTLLGATQPGNLYIGVGPNDDATNDRIDVVGGLGDLTYDGAVLGLAQAAIATSDDAQAYLTTVDTALDALNGQRAELGSLTNRLESATNFLSVSVENLSGAESRIRNVDVAAESAELSRNQILQQAATAILSQANQAPSLALSLIGGR